MIVAEGVSKHYGDRVALQDVSFSIDKGEVVGFLGLNGAGKTTMLKILCGLLLPSAGRIRVDGVDGMEQPLLLRSLIGFLPDRPPLYPEMTVRQMLTHAGRLNGTAKPRIAGRVDDVLALASLTHVADDLVEWLSHGYRQRVGIACAIVHEPKLVVLDEPISGLDPAQIVAMRSLIRGLKEKHTVLLSSHILGEISQTCDRILVLHGGRIVAQGNEASLAQQQNRVEVVLRGDRAAAARVAEHSNGVSDVAAEVIVAGEGTIKLTASIASTDAREKLVAAFVSGGFGVRSVRDASTGLEDVFLQLTKQAAPTIEGGRA